MRYVLLCGCVLYIRLINKIMAHLNESSARWLFVQDANFAILSSSIKKCEFAYWKKWFWNETNYLYLNVGYSTFVWMKCILLGVSTTYFLSCPYLSSMTFIEKTYSFIFSFVTFFVALRLNREMDLFSLAVHVARETPSQDVFHKIP